MKILIVDDSSQASGRIRGNLSAASDIEFLAVSDPELANSIVDFGIKADVALVDLRFANAGSTVGDDYYGLSVCQKIRAAMPKTVIIGYSTSFSLNNEVNRQLGEKFTSMGADMVCDLAHLTLTPTSELRKEFQSAREMRFDGQGGRRRPKIFIGSSTEGLDEANHIQVGLVSDFEVVVWNQASFGLGQMTIEALEKAVQEFQFAIFVFTPDDQLTSRGETKNVARDNVIFEAGLFIGGLGRQRTFVVMPDGNGLTLPSDLAGLTVAKFHPKSENKAAALGPACQRIKDAVNRILKNDSLT